MSPIKRCQIEAQEIHRCKGQQVRLSLAVALSTIQDVTNKRRETKSRPKGVVDYNDQIGGVDKVDQHLAPYFTSRKREENTKIFFHLWDLAL
ncbi:hypothetical protein TNCV_1978391 [Trichonephila clavipes]|nr:hypothetical protein TNCV_1978391 [Trichonephila clavipes]